MHITASKHKDLIISSANEYGTSTVTLPITVKAVSSNAVEITFNQFINNFQ